jgi:hypothetical protein
MKRLLSSLSAFFVVLIVGCILAVPVSATNDMDGLTGGNTAQEQQVDQGSNSRDAGALGDALQNYNPITDDNMSQAQALANPITNIIGNIIGAIVLLTAAGIFLVTALDLAYIAMPFTRPLLTSKHQLVSDEALAAVGGASGGQQAGGMGSPMGSPMGGMGGMGSPMGSPMGGGMGGQQKQSTKSVITTYFKKRVVFMVIFAVATVILTSSILTGVGINLAALLTEIINKLNSIINGVKV